ncbi:MAG: aminodeoxychorismate/anthranilate synthase component II [Clostridiales bacterium]
MIVLIDNYDSFSYNLYQLIGTVRSDIKVLRNDACTVEELEAMAPAALFLSPGPGHPAKAGICEAAVRALAGQVPIFGVCLGHQAIIEAFGGTVSYAKCLMHGKPSLIGGEPDSRLFRGLEEPFPAARYHSLAALEAAIPDVLRVTARTTEGEVMAVEHRDYPVCGVQFHPESIMTPMGETIIRTFFASLSLTTLDRGNLI